MEDRIHDLSTKLERLKDQVDHLGAMFDSERGTVQREHKRIHEELGECEKELHEIMYDPENGLVLKVDRLDQEQIKRDKERWQLYGLWVMVLAGLIDKALQLLSKH